MYMYYFAYGSNMNLEHMRKLCGWHCQLLCRTKLPNFEVGLDSRGYANIRPKVQDEVWGLLFEIDEDGLNMLDEFEGYPTVFGREEVTVFDDNKVKYKAQVYIEPATEFGGNEARVEYFRRVIGAAYEHHLPEEWIRKLEGFLGCGKK
jgi:gamma-glutamylcyclotransferase (GGCT)/AIG2-like uncharacterized protein YtfP